MTTKTVEQCFTSGQRNNDYWKVANAKTETYIYCIGDSTASGRLVRCDGFRQIKGTNLFKYQTIYLRWSTKLVDASGYRVRTAL